MSLVAYAYLCAFVLRCDQFLLFGLVFFFHASVVFIVHVGFVIYHSLVLEGCKCIYSDTFVKGPHDSISVHLGKMETVEVRIPGRILK